MNSMFPSYLQQLFDKNFSVDKSMRQQRFSLFLKTYVPQGLTLVKISGTNGKGSVSCLLESCLLEDNKKVGLFTSPHLHCITERIRINGVQVSLELVEEQAKQLVSELTEFTEKNGVHFWLSFFECMIIMALRLFRAANVDVAIMEAGIGGYHDATHFLKAPISAITSIGLDHPQQLGETLEEVAQDKAGIASDDSTLVLAGNIGESLLQLIQEDCSRRGVSLSIANGLFDNLKKDLTGARFDFHYKHQFFPVELPLLGDFQLQNFSTVAAIAEYLYAEKYLDNLSAIQGVKNARWPGRMEYFSGNPAIFFDVAHNAEALDALADTLDSLIPKKQRVFLSGFSEDKNYADCLKRLRELSDRIYLTEGFYKAVAVDKLQAFVPNAMDCFKSAEQGLSDLQKHYADSGACLIITGSVFLTGKLRAAYLSP